MGRTHWHAAWLLGLVCSIGGCDAPDDGTEPTTPETLPALTLTDDTPELLFTWLDDKGRTHTATTTAEIPDGGKSLVRVVTKDAGNGSLFYVADLTQKNGDGSYTVRSMPRGDWERRIDELRQAERAKHAPAPASSPPPALDGNVEAVVYGAEWCKPCHQAADYLKKRGVKVKQVDVEKEPRYAREMQDKLRRAGMGGGSIPIIDVAGQILQGFSPGALDRAIAKLKRDGTQL